MQPRPRLAVSACLAGVPCRYDARPRTDESIQELVSNGEAFPVCPEVLGGLPTPRPPAEIVGGDGDQVLDGEAEVHEADGTEVTAAYVDGARKAADQLTGRGITRAVLQARSPSCGCGEIYDGSHTGDLAEGDGVFAAELRRRGLEVEPRRGQRSQVDETSR